MQIDNHLGSAGTSFEVGLASLKLYKCFQILLREEFHKKKNPENYQLFVDTHLTPPYISWQN